MKIRRLKRQNQLKQKQKHRSIKFGPLTELAYKKLLTTLCDEFHNRLTDLQKAALKGVLNSYTCMAIGGLRGRWAYPLPTGMGKTTSIIAWLTALYELGYQDVSTVVCASKVEALCSLKRDLIKAGVPENEIGLIHSYQHDEEKARKGEPRYASLPATHDNENKRILLATHNKVRSSKDPKEKVELLYTYKGARRNLVIYDETLLTSDSTSMPMLKVKAGLEYLRVEARSDIEKEVVSYFDDCFKAISSELEAQKQGAEPKVLNLPEVSNDKIKLYYSVCLADKAREVATQFLQQLLELTKNELRVLNNDGTGLISFEIVVPPELNNIIILDASHNIRQLVEYDKSIKTALNPDVKLVSYEKVIFHLMDKASGRYSVTPQFKAKGQLLKEYIHVIKDLIPVDEAILIFTFKQKDKRDVNFTKETNKCPNLGFGDFIERV